MPSSKFSSRPLTLKRPTVCKPKPPRTPIEQRPWPPQQLHAFVDFTDLDPIQHAWQQDLIKLDYDATKHEYFGRTAIAGERLELTFAATPNKRNWDATLVVYGWWPGPATFSYPGIPVPIDRPFGTPSFGDVVISGKDFRVIQILE